MWHADQSRRRCGRPISPGADVALDVVTRVSPAFGCGAVPAGLVPDSCCAAADAKSTQEEEEEEAEAEAESSSEDEQPAPTVAAASDT